MRTCMKASLQCLDKESGKRKGSYMEEEKKETEQTVSQPAEEKPKESFGRSTRYSYILRIFASIYLLYTAYSLVQGIQNGEGKSSPLIIVGIVVFVVFGVVFLFTGVKGYQAENRKAREEEEEEKSAAPRVQEPEKKKSMSIAERAGLVQSLQENEAEEENRPEEEE